MADVPVCILLFIPIHIGKVVGHAGQVDSDNCPSLKSIFGWSSYATLILLIHPDISHVHVQ